MAEKAVSIRGLRRFLNNLKGIFLSKEDGEDFVHKTGVEQVGGKKYFNAVDAEHLEAGHIGVDFSELADFDGNTLSGELRKKATVSKVDELEGRIDEIVTVPIRYIRILDNGYYYKVFPYKFKGGSVSTYFGTVGAPEDEDVLIKLPDDYSACKVIVPLDMRYSTITTASSYVVTEYDEYSGADLEDIAFSFNGEKYVVIAAGTGVILHWTAQSCKLFKPSDGDILSRHRIGEGSLLRTAYIKATPSRYLIASESSTSSDTYVFKWMTSGSSPAQYQPYIDTSLISAAAMSKAFEHRGLVIDIAEE